MTKRQRKNRRRVNRLTELWPELFSQEAPKPLKVGIFDDLMQDLAARGWHSGQGHYVRRWHLMRSVRAITAP